jgi:hypothetical protein
VDITPLSRAVRVQRLRAPPEARGRQRIADPSESDGRFEPSERGVIVKWTWTDVDVGVDVFGDEVVVGPA